MKKLKSKGITLVSLVITIVVLLIISGVIVAAIVGRNSSIKRAQEAKIEAELRAKKEQLDEVLMKYNLGNTTLSLGDFLKKELNLSNTYVNTSGNTVANIATFTDLNGKTAYVIHDFLDESAYITQDENGKWGVNGVGDKEVGYVEYLDGGEVLIAPQSGDELDLTFTDPSNPSSYPKYAIITSEQVEDLSFDIPANKHVEIKLLSDFQITNAGLKRSAINLNSGSVLDLVVEGNVIVNSTLGEDANGAVPGKGGYAGIHVPGSATLNLSGSGTITAYGGNAGSGSNYYGHANVYTAGGGGAGAGIGGNGGNGAAGAGGQSTANKICQNGGSGEACGKVTIGSGLTVYAYGGGGGSGGTGGKYKSGGAGGGGGYPAAGIGGGGGGRSRLYLLCWSRRFYSRFSICM